MVDRPQRLFAIHSNSERRSQILALTVDLAAVFQGAAALHPITMAGSCKMTKRLTQSTALALFMLSSLNIGFAQNDPQELQWVRFGNCWSAQPGFLYCGDSHPLTVNNTGTFLSLVCFGHYHAVLLNHPHNEVESEVRKIHSQVGDNTSADVWISASPTESFFSNQIHPDNTPYYNVLLALSKPQSASFRFIVEPGNIEDAIVLTGQEYEAANTYMDMCKLR